MLSKSVFAGSLLLAASVYGAAVAAPGATISAGARLAATCAACHGTDGAIRDGIGGATLPRLAGQSQQALSASLHAFKSGTRPATIMTQIAQGYTGEQIELLSAYFAAQKK